MRLRPLSEKWAWTILAIAAAVLCGLLAYTVYDSSVGRSEALRAAIRSAESADAQRATTTRRIDLLLEEVETLSKQVDVANSTAAATNARAAALEEQLIRLGARPIVTALPPQQFIPTTTTAPQPTTTTTATSAPTTLRQQTTTTSPRVAPRESTTTRPRLTTTTRPGGSK